jgi:hypothetical protein
MFSADLCRIIAIPERFEHRLYMRGISIGRLSRRFCVTDRCRTWHA